MEHLHTPVYQVDHTAITLVQTEKDKRIDELATLKIKAIEHVATAIEQSRQSNEIISAIYVLAESIH